MRSSRRLPPPFPKLIMLPPSPATTTLVRVTVEFAGCPMAPALKTGPAMSSYTIEATGNPVKIDAILDLLRPLGLKELVRTGAVAIGRGAKGWKG